jgi:GNAT superfamily N-acetyltransferase
MEWKAEAFITGVGTSFVNLNGLARGPDQEHAVASAETCIIDAVKHYGVPDIVPKAMVLRFSRIRTMPEGQGGGSAALKAALAEADRFGFWTVLESTPYPGHSQRKTDAFYKKHGFKHRRGKDRHALYRPPESAK